MNVKEMQMYATRWVDFNENFETVLMTEIDYLRNEKRLTV